MFSGASRGRSGRIAWSTSPNWKARRAVHTDVFNESSLSNRRSQAHIDSDIIKAELFEKFADQLPSIRQDNTAILARQMGKSLEGRRTAKRSELQLGHSSEARSYVRLWSDMRHEKEAEVHTQVPLEVGNNGRKPDAIIHNRKEDSAIVREFKSSGLYWGGLKQGEDVIRGHSEISKRGLGTLREYQIEFNSDDAVFHKETRKNFSKLQRTAKEHDVILRYRTPSQKSFVSELVPLKHSPKRSRQVEESSFSAVIDPDSE